MVTISHDHAWNYFELHANQRIALFRFYILFFTIYSSGAGFMLIHFNDRGILPEVAAITFSITFLLITSVFKALDERNVQLISYTQSALRFYENKNFPDKELRVFNNEDDDKNNGKSCIGHRDLFKRIYLVGKFATVVYIILVFTKIGIIKIPLCILCS